MPTVYDLEKKVYSYFCKNIISKEKAQSYLNRLSKIFNMASEELEAITEELMKEIE